MGDTYKEVCLHDKEVLKEASQLLPVRCLSDDTWEQSQDTTTNTELSRDSAEVDLKSHNVSSTESQDSLLIANTMPQRTDDINICVSPFYGGHVENTEEGFNLLGESPKRRSSGDTSIENSPKRMNFGNTCDAKLANFVSSPTKTNVECAMTSARSKTHAASTGSASESSSMEECQVVPTTVSISSESVLYDNTLESHKLLENCGQPIKYDDTVTSAADVMESDKMIPKPRQASVDSVLDSGIGDSCNSVDSTEKYGMAELKNRTLEGHCWQPKIRESIATRLPGTHSHPGFVVFHLICINFSVYPISLYFLSFYARTFLSCVRVASSINIATIVYREFLLSTDARQVHFPRCGGLFRA